MIEYIDPETGLYYLRARYYDPKTGQFITPDPLNAITGERYGYAGNNPLNYDDPLGLCSSWKSWNCAKQSVANVSGGVLDGITLGHSKGVLNHVPFAGSHNADKVNWQSDGAHTGGVLGAAMDAPFALWAPEAFGAVATASTIYNVVAKCALGPGCSNPGDWLVMFADVGVGGIAGLTGLPGAALVSLALSRYKLDVSPGHATSGLAAGVDCGTGTGRPR